MHFHSREQRDRFIDKYKKQLEVNNTKKTTINILEQIKGINLEEALERFSDNEELYLSILKEFIVECCENLEEIKEGLHTFDINKAIAASHKLKGTASNISVIKVSKKAEILERALRNEKDNRVTISAHELKKLYQELNEVSVEFIKSITEAEKE